MGNVRRLVYLTLTEEQAAAVLTVVRSAQAEESPRHVRHVTLRQAGDRIDQAAAQPVTVRTFNPRTSGIRTGQ